MLSPERESSRKGAKVRKGAEGRKEKDSSWRSLLIRAFA
jgi:hypothetical protein